MPEASTDPERDLVRWAYRSQEEDFDVEAGLHDVVRRTDRPVARRRLMPVVAAFAASVVVILVVVLVTTGVPRGDRAPAGGLVSASGSPTLDGPRQYTDPLVLPSGCNSAWALSLTGGKFVVTTRPEESCPPLAVRSFWLLDEASGNGNIGPGDAKLWAVTPVGTTSPMLTAPFAFRAHEEWPGPIAGHAYTLAFVLPEELASVHSGDDAYVHLDRTHFLSLTVTSW